MSKKQKDISILQSLDRALDLISILANSREPLSVIDLSKSLSANRTTIYATLNTLLMHNFIEKDETSGKYTIGPRLYELGLMYRYKFPFTSTAEKLAEMIVKKWKLQVNVGIYNDRGNVLLLLTQLPVDTPILPISYSMPAYVTGLGKVLLAALPDKDLDQLLHEIDLKKYTKNTIMDKEQLKKELLMIREKGYACDNEEYIEGLSCIAAPIKDYSEKTIASISVSGGSSRIKGHKEELINEVLSMSKRISIELGWRT